MQLCTIPQQIKQAIMLIQVKYHPMRFEQPIVHDKTKIKFLCVELSKLTRLHNNKFEAQQQNLNLGV